MPLSHRVDFSVCEKNQLWCPEPGCGSTEITKKAYLNVQIFNKSILTTDPIIGRWVVASVDVVLAALVLVGLLVRDVRKAVHAAASLERRATSSRRRLTSIDSIKATSDNVIIWSPLVLENKK